MKLLFVHDHPFFPESDSIYSGGGLPSSIWKNYLENFESVIVYGRKSKNVKDKKVISSYENVLFRLTEHYSSSLDFFKNIKKIELEIQDLIVDVDVALVRLPSVLGFVASKVANKMNKPLWVEQVGNTKEALNTFGTLQGKIAAPFLECYNKHIVKNASFVSYVTENKLQVNYPTSCKSVTVSMSDVLINSVLKEQDLNYNRFKNNPFRIGLIGGFDARYKGQDILLKAISSIKLEKRVNIKINLVGKGNYNWILNLANELNLVQNIEYLGPLEPGKQINDFLRDLSLYVQPSLTEGMPRSTIEAMALGSPVIGSDAGGIPEIVSKKFIHERGDINKLAYHIEYLYDNREELYQEALSSLTKVIPFMKATLDKKRSNFYFEMNRTFTND